LGKVFLSVDAEGLPFIVNPLQLIPGGRLFHELREVMTKVVSSVSEALIELGNEVIVADSHGFMTNLDPMKLPSKVRVVRGFPRPLSMVYGGKGCDYALLIGYHSGAGRASTLAHTYSSRVVHRLLINDIDASEYVINALLLGEWGVPVALVAGSAELENEVRKFTPWAVWIPLSEPAGYMASMSKSIEDVISDLRNGVREADKRFRTGEVKPLRMSWDKVKLCVELIYPLYAEAVSLIPGVRRVNGRTVCYDCKSVEEAYRVFEAIIFTAGFTAYMQELMRR